MGLHTFRPEHRIGIFGLTLFALASWGCGDTDTAALDGSVDSAIQVDSGPCILCAAPPEGCQYLNGSCMSCGTLDCGGLCGSDIPVSCETGDYCAHSDGCGSLGERGMCEARGSGICPDINDPVCGCDGNTYSSDCVAHGAGVNVNFKGSCESPKTCGGIAGDACDGGEWCDFDDCSISDAAGVCKIRPDDCPENIDPVCGCDQVTYDNVCKAHAMGMDVASQGACVSE